MGQALSSGSSINEQKELYQRWCYSLSGILILAILTFFLFSETFSPLSNPLLQELWNLGHLVYFWVYSFLILQIPQVRRLNTAQIWILVLGSSTLIGGLIELSQAGSERSADLDDWIKDIAGSWLCLIFHPAVNRSIRNGALTTLKIISLSLFVFMLLPAVRLTFEFYQMHQKFPIIVDFKTEDEVLRFSGNSERKWLATEQMQITFVPTGVYSGASLEYFPTDWSGYETINLEIANLTAETFPVTLKIHDHQHRETFFHNDRYNQKLTLLTGLNKFRIPLTEIFNAPKKRSMNTKQITVISLFTSRIRSPKTITLNKINLD